MFEIPMNSRLGVSVVGFVMTMMKLLILGLKMKTSGNKYHQH